MDDSEVIVLIFSFILAGIGTAINRVSSLHPLYFRGNPGPGIVRAGVLLAMGWIAFVLWNYADPSVTGFYIFFYLVMGYAAVKMFGQTMAAAFGARTRIDVGERRNVPAALVIASFTLATGLIFGGSLWGEADPVGDDEGGWWIPVSFFLLGWVSLCIAFGLFLRREQALRRDWLRRDRSIADARAAAVFLLGAGVALTDAVSGDFWGWAHGLLTFGVLAALLIAHELFAPRRGTGGGRGREGGGDTRGRDAGRVLETVAYALLAVVAWGLNRYLNVLLGGG